MFFNLIRIKVESVPLKKKIRLKIYQQEDVLFFNTRKLRGGKALVHQLCLQLNNEYL
jgi:hypothetical protein